MNALVNGIFQLAITGTLVLLAVLLILKLADNHISENLKYRIVLCAMVCMVIPMTQLIPSVAIDIIPEPTILNAIRIPNPSSPTQVHQALDPSINLPEVSKRMDYQFEYTQIYFLVVFILSLRYLIKYQKFIRSRKIHRVNLSETSVSTLIEPGVKLEYTDEIISPFVYGIMQRTIVMPVNVLGQKGIEYMVEHELVHYRRRDVLIKTLVNVVHIIHWFNPFMIFFKKRIFEYMETSCDETVTQLLNERERKDYALLILNAIQLSSTPVMTMGTSFSTTKNRLIHRIEAFMNPKKLSNTKKYGIISLVLMMIVGLGFLSKNVIFASPSPTPPKTEEPKTPIQEIEEPEKTGNIEPDPVPEETPEPEKAPDYEEVAAEEGESQTDQEEAVDVETESPQFIYPVRNSYVMCGFECYTGHMGMDIAANGGNYGRIYAIGRGVVIEAAYDMGGIRGNYIKILHDNGYISTYSHMEALEIEVGTEVDSETYVGYIGMTGITSAPHVHLELIDLDGNLINPEPYLS